MEKTRVVIYGYGNVGKYVLDAAEAAEDIEVVGVIRHGHYAEQPEELKKYRVVTDVKDILDLKPEVAILATPTRKVPEAIALMHQHGLSTVDSFDIHSEIVPLRERAMQTAKEQGLVSVIAAGWDPGSDSVVRTLMEAIVPRGITYTNFGPGMSMGHTVAVKAIDGVKKALSVTIPLGTGVHRRMVYVELADGATAEVVEQVILSDPYFVNDETHVTFVEDVDALKDMGHGVLMERKGGSGHTQNQLLSFEMRINNPALTAQIMVACARATKRLNPGCYTMLEIPVVDLLPGERAEWIARLC